jgi:hypothetical protein
MASVMALASIFGFPLAAQARKGRKKKRKRQEPCDRCPARGCCQCEDPTQVPIRCTLIPGKSGQELGAACAEICGTPPFGLISVIDSGNTMVCAPDHRCQIAVCPLV